jgi:hypothetical protein
MIPLMVGMAGASMLANHMNNKQADKQNAKAAHAAATQTQFSPWTKMGAGQAQYTPTQSNLNAGLQGAMSGASFGQSYGQAQSQKGLVDAQKDFYQSQSSPWMTRKQDYLDNGKLMGNQHRMAGGGGMMG